MMCDYIYLLKLHRYFFFLAITVSNIFCIQANYTSQLFQKAVNKNNLPRFKVNENNFFTGTRTIINDGMFLKKKIVPECLGLFMLLIDCKQIKL